ncbi:MAG: right-handed parallel beta-helix repeat-containing protein [Chloroflexi bacterium]|nr:right-handed parallel beta-helix repeat-containing protein [Chloroflexota bacterium]
MSSMWIRLNIGATVVIGLLLVAVMARGAYGGPLDPPGPPGSTDGVQGPGTPISSLPFAISQPGYYYVTRHLTGAAGQPGITITTSNVTLDLGGFTLLGGPSAQDGIDVVGPRNIVVRNGALRGWFNGINFQATYSRIERVQVMSNANQGIIIGALSLVTDCVASLNGSNGIYVIGGTVRNCTIGENSPGMIVDTNSIVEGNRVYNNGSTGIDVIGDFTVVRDNQARGHSGADILIESQSDNTILARNLSCLATIVGTNTLLDQNQAWTTPC